MQKERFVSVFFVVFGIIATTLHAVEPVKVWDLGEDVLWQAPFSNTGAYILSTDHLQRGMEVRVRDANTGDVEFTIKPWVDEMLGTNAVGSIAFSTDDSVVLVGDSAYLSFWKTKTGTIDKSIFVYRGAYAVDLQSDQSAFIVASGDGILTVYDTNEGTPIKQYMFDMFPPFYLSYMPDGKSFLAMSTMVASLIKRDTGETIRKLSWGNQQLLGGMSQDKSRAFALKGSGQIVVWDPLQDGDQAGFAKTLIEINDSKTAALSPTGSYIAVLHADNQIRIWNIDMQNIVETIPHPDPAEEGIVDSTVIAFTPDGKQLLVGSSNALHQSTVRFWDMASLVNTTIESWTQY